MEKQKKNFIEWVKAHKKELIITGISATIIIAVILCTQNKESIKKLWRLLKRSINDATSNIDEVIQITYDVVGVTSKPAVNIVKSTPKCSFEVNRHIRNLPKGQNASAEKLAKAAEQGFALLQGQTWVEKYTKGAIAA